MLAALTFAAMTDTLYHEAYRPQFHFSAKKNWLNDPNGLVFYEGQYHLFFQHNPNGIQWGDMHWGHAVSPDLFHWTELEPAIAPDDHGTVYSGSAAIDWHNTSGLGVDGKPVIALMYTGAGKPFTQCLVTSPDGGKTWSKYKGNPVVPHIADENRDPRIFWHEPSKQWIMALYLTGDEYAILGSPDLKNWKEQSRLHVPGSGECPELFEMPVEGSHDTRWVFYGGNFRYMVGQFDGHTFHPESSPTQIDFGDCFYASQTYNNAPHGRRIQIGWMHGDGPLPGMPFNQQMSCPCDLTLKPTSNGLRIFKQPVHELDRLHGHHERGRNLTVSQANDLLAKLPGDSLDIRLHLTPGADTKIRIRGTELTFPAGKASLEGTEAPFTPGNIRILVDRSSIEIFLNDGAETITRYFKPNLDVHGVEITGSVSIDSLDAFEVKSAWP